MNIYLQSFLRHTLTGIGSALAMKYGISGEEVDVIVGGVMTLAGLAWAFYDKKKSK